MENSQKSVFVKNVELNNNKNFVLIAGPCQIESLDHSLFLCEKILKTAEETKTKFIFKASYDKANRTSLHSKRGVGLEKGLEILLKVKEKFNVPVTTDVHETHQVKPVSETVDLIQIPAFLCRQTDLLIEAAKTRKPINVKKGQFLAPWDMKNVIEKISSFGNQKILLCERGTCFGYNNLVNDFKGIPVMKNFGYPVVFDATHSVQMPGGKGDKSSGNAEFVEYLARAAVAVGVAGIFLETHEDPSKSPSDGDNMVKLDNLKNLLTMLKNIDEIVKTKEEKTLLKYFIEKIKK